MQKSKSQNDFKEAAMSNESTKKAGMLFAKELTNLRKSAGLSQSRFAKKWGVSRWSVSQYEIGVRLPSVSGAQKLQQRFKVDAVNWLLTSYQEIITAAERKYEARRATQGEVVSILPRGQKPEKGSAA
jgi:transcriptional regulator with XRE-family HTH domain